MLKIKNDIDLKELEKFGFTDIVYDGDPLYYHKRIYSNLNGIDYYIHKNERGISIKIFGTLDDVLIDRTLYDLIKAGLVEKIEE
jgi:hypothetical protein